MSDYEKNYYEHEGFWNSEKFMLDNKERIEKTTEILPKDIKSLLDVGCGNGLFCNHVNQLRPELKIVGFDRSKTALKYLKTETCEGVITKLPFNDSSIDCVSSLQVIEHLSCHDYPVALNEIYRVSSKYILLSVPYMQDIEKDYTKCPECKTIFNLDLHLRSFCENDLLELFGTSPAKLLVKSFYGYFDEYLYHDKYVNLFYRCEKLSWKSPICPLCGYEEVTQKDGNVLIDKSNEPFKFKNKLLPAISYLPKKFWPKIHRPYGVIALFEKPA